MTEQPQTPESTEDAAGEIPADPSAPGAGPVYAAVPGAGPADGHSLGAGPAYAPAPGAGDRPEVAVGAAFAGGFLFAMILRRLAR